MKKNRTKPSFVYYLALWGCISTGILYTAIGVIAILSFLRIKNGGADEGSLLVFFDKFFIGKIVVGIIMIGMIAYIIRRMYEAIMDPYGYGKEPKGILRRIVIALSSLADALIAYTAIQALLGTGSGIVENGQPIAQREVVHHVLKEGWGYWAVVIVGIITCMIALIQFGYVVSKSYLERLDIDFLKQWKRVFIHILAWAGHIARGVILGIIGVFFIKAAISNNAHYVVNTDKAFDFIGDDVGHLYFILVAIATICYGVFMFVFGIYYNPGKE